jgi:predicted dinucleotide-binding enzyme
MKIGILGTGNMGRPLGLLWAEQGHEVFFGNRTIEKAHAAAALSRHACQSGSLDDAARFGDVLLHTARHAMPSGMVGDAAAWDGKILIDLNNSQVVPGFEFEPVTESFAERIQADSPGLRVVKAFNTIPLELFEHCPDDIREFEVTIFVAGDDAEAKSVVSGLADELGFKSLDSGGLRNARLLESLADLYRYLVVKGGDGGIGLYSHISARVVPAAAAQRLGGRARTELRPSK